ncbi:MAG: MutS family DNA mismatch repair protein, partial [Sedimentisphaerales bacterium]|nr:MutS family DNA mismatch repair protein [Sedimentisphaerales bacterium]
SDGICTVMTRIVDRAKPQRRPPGRSSCREWLTACRERVQGDHTRYRRLETRWSRIRLAVFLGGIGLVIVLRGHPPLVTAAAGAGLAAFLVAILRHTSWEGKRAFAERLLVVANESLHASVDRDRPVRAWQRPEDTAGTAASLPALFEPGPEWPLTDQERDDLDLYGPPVGIFGLLNRTSTDLGARRLRDMLDRPLLSAGHIDRRQHAVEWLAGHHEQRLRIMASLAALRGGSARLDTLVRLLHETGAPTHRLISKGIRLWSVCGGLLVVYAVFRIVAGHYEWGRPLVGVLVLNGLIQLVCHRMFARLEASVAPWADLRSVLQRLLVVAERANRELPNETILDSLNDHFHRVAARARIPSLCAWLEWAALHGLVRGLLNAVVLLDLHVAEAVLARVVPNRDVLLRGLSALAELEALCSLACFSAEPPVACYPKFTPGAGLSLTEGRHPLVPERDVVANSMSLTPEKRTWVITGPNAAGKSTFLRMVGVNSLLAQIGAAVPAREMTGSPVRLMTDVRIRDDLARHESYFLSEVRRLRRMVQDTETASPMLGLIDEPFRGTNSQERTAAGIALLEHLMASSHYFIVATHEETLAATGAAAAEAENHHFQEHLTDGGIAFDYLLRPGPAVTKTALRILEREGYPRAFMERARSLMPPADQP